MLANVLSKPLQGNLFRKFRDVLLGRAHVSSLRIPAGLLREERVVRSGLTREGMGASLHPFGMN